MTEDLERLRFDYTAKDGADSKRLVEPHRLVSAGMIEVAEVLDRRDEVLYVYGDRPRLSGSVRRNFADGSVLNANAAVGLLINDVEEVSLRSGPGQPDRER